MAVNKHYLLDLIKDHEQDDDYYIYSITYNEHRITTFYIVYSDVSIMKTQRRAKREMNKHDVFKQFKKSYDDIKTYTLDKYNVTEKVIHNINGNANFTYTLYQLNKEVMEYILK